RAARASVYKDPVPGGSRHEHRFALAQVEEGEMKTVIARLEQAPPRDQGDHAERQGGVSRSQLERWPGGQGTELEPRRQKSNKRCGRVEGRACPGTETAPESRARSVGSKPADGNQAAKGRARELTEQPAEALRDAATEGAESRSEHDEGNEGLREQVRWNG